MSAPFFYIVINDLNYYNFSSKYKQMESLKMSSSSDSLSNNHSKPSKVLFVRSLPNDSTEEDLARIFSQYGKVDRVFMLIHKA